MLITSPHAPLVTSWIDNDEPHTETLAFTEANDGLDDVEFLDLLENGYVCGGGGASPRWHICAI
mgnify:CR=1 FL=1